MLQSKLRMRHFSISKTARSYPPLPFESMKNDILGRTYDLSLVFVGERKALELNETYRNKSYTPNVLSFPLTPESGEIYIAPKIAKKEANKFNMTYKTYVGYLFIHGLLHLKGFKHGDKMERLERKFLKKFRLT